MPIQKSGQFQKYDFGKTKNLIFASAFFAFEMHMRTYVLQLRGDNISGR